MTPTALYQLQGLTYFHGLFMLQNSKILLIYTGKVVANGNGLPKLLAF